jgi:hypothetical protein
MHGANAKTAWKMEEIKSNMKVVVAGISNIIQHQVILFFCGNEKRKRTFIQYSCYAVGQQIQKCFLSLSKT